MQPVVHALPNDTSKSTHMLHEVTNNRHFFYSSKTKSTSSLGTLLTDSYHENTSHIVVNNAAHDELAHVNSYMFLVSSSLGVLPVGSQR